MLKIKDDHLIIQVKDTGSGISLQMKKNIFKLFDNFKYKNIVNSGGCGIGLTICY